MAALACLVVAAKDDAHEPTTRPHPTIFSTFRATGTLHPQETRPRARNQAAHENRYASQPSGSRGYTTDWQQDFLVLNREECQPTGGCRCAR